MRGLSVALVADVAPEQDARAANVEVEAGFSRGVACGQAAGDGAGGGDVVCGVGGVFGRGVAGYVSLPRKPCGSCAVKIVGWVDSLTNHDVSLGRGFLNDIRGIVVAIDELRGRILGLHGFAALFVAYEERVRVLWVSLVQCVENVTADVAWRSRCQTYACMESEMLICGEAWYGLAEAC